MIHSMSGGVISENGSYIYVFVQIEGGLYKGEKRWYISPFKNIKAGDRAEIPVGSRTAAGRILRVEYVTAQTAPFPLNRTREIERIL